MNNFKKGVSLVGMMLGIIVLSGCALLEKPVRNINLEEEIIPTKKPVAVNENIIPTETAKIAISNGEFIEWPEWATKLGFSHPIGLTLDKEQSAISVYDGELVDSVTAVYTGNMKTKIATAENLIKKLAPLGVSEVTYSPRKNGLVGIIASNSQKKDKTYDINIMANESILQITVFNATQK